MVRVLACVAVVSSLLASHVAASARGDGVRASDLPSLGQAAQIYDYLEGGRRDVIDYPYIAVRRTRNCLNQKEAPSPASGQRAYYNMPSGRPLVEGLAEPDIAVYQFDSIANARHGMIIQRRAIRRCEGTTSAFRDFDGQRYRVTSREVAIREFGDGRVAHREFVKSEFGPDPERQNFALVWVREGRYLIKAQAQRYGEAPSVRNVARLAAMSLRNLR